VTVGGLAAKASRPVNKRSTGAHAIRLKLSPPASARRSPAAHASFLRAATKADR